MWWGHQVVDTGTVRDVTACPPLDDPAYRPAHPITADGGVPDVVAKWGPRSQRRWFLRYNGQLRPRNDWYRFYCDSLDHTGQCCDSCLDDYADGYDDPPGDTCCCRGFDAATARAAATTS